MKTKIRLLLLAVLLTAAAWPEPATARCLPGYCWEVSEWVTCCYEESGCVIVCG